MPRGVPAGVAWGGDDCTVSRGSVAGATKGGSGLNEPARQFIIFGSRVQISSGTCVRMGR